MLANSKEEVRCVWTLTQVHLLHAYVWDGLGVLKKPLDGRKGLFFDLLSVAGWLVSYIYVCMKINSTIYLTLPLLLTLSTYQGQQGAKLEQHSIRSNRRPF